MIEAGLGGSIADLGRRFRTGETTPAEIVRASLDRIEAVGTELGAVADVMAEAHREAARLTDELAAGHDRGPLHGIPVVVKELIDVAGYPRRAGSHVRPSGWGDPVPTDAPVVARLREAGAVIVARGRTHEFAWGITSRHPDGTGVVNPWDRSRIAGGSSGGVAALVAAGCVPVGIGTDTGGSVRIPAAFCGLVGWKPAQGRLSTRGVVPLAPTFDTVGVLTRTIADALDVDRVLGSGLAGPPGSPDGGRGAHPDAVALLVDRSVPTPMATVADALTKTLESAGVTGMVHAGDAVPSAREIVDVYAVLQRAEALAVHRDLLGSWPAQADAYGRDVAGRLREAEALDPDAVVEARVARRDVQARWHVTAVGVDVFVTATVGCAPPGTDDPDEATVDGVSMPLREAVMGSTIPANLLSWPALAVPLAPTGPSSIPPSIHLLARPGREHRLADVPAHLTA